MEGSGVGVSVFLVDIGVRQLYLIEMYLCGDYCPKDGIFHGMRTEFAKIESCRIIRGIGQSMRVGEIATAHPYFPRNSVHFPKEESHIVTPPHQLLHLIQILQAVHFHLVLLQHPHQYASHFGYQICCVIATWQHHAKEEVIQRIHCSLGEFGSGADYSAAVFTGPNPQSLRFHSRPVHQMQDGHQIHHFGETGHLPLLIVPPSVQTAPLPHLIQHPALC